MSARLLLTEQEAADRLLLCPRTLRRLRQAGEIRYVALTGRKIAYRPEDCDAFIERRTRQDISPSRPRPKGRAGSRGQNSGNVLSFTQRRQARIAGQGR